MSAIRSLAIPLPKITPDGDKRHLKPVETAHGRKPRKSPLFLSIVGVIGVLAILTAQLWLNLSVSGGAYEISELAYEQRELSRSERALQLEVDMLSSPQNLAVEAVSLGMVQNLRPAYLELETNKIIGSITQTTVAAKANLIGNSALAELKAPTPKPKPKPEAAKPEVAKPEAASAPAPVAPVVELERIAENDTGIPVTWDGQLKAPVTH